MAHSLPYYYAPDGTYVLFVDLVGFTAFVRSSFQRNAQPHNDRLKEDELAQRQFKAAQLDVEREYRRFHEHLEALLRRAMHRGRTPTMSLVFSDCAYMIFERPHDAERFAVRTMRSFIRNDMPVRIVLSYGSFTSYEFKTGMLSKGHMMFAAPFMGTSVVDAYRAESSGIKGLRILVHPSFFMTAPDLDDVLVPLPKSEQRPEAVGELNWYDVDLRLTFRQRSVSRRSP
ncbi:MAG TPA: hypothetical protein VJN96_19695 [Vicinamibacterales bacterium]|nr:hypothetical protein [Vicinamibacterales bacterium]